MLFLWNGTLKILQPEVWPYGTKQILCCSTGQWFCRRVPGDRCRYCLLTLAVPFPSNYNADQSYVHQGGGKLLFLQAVPILMRCPLCPLATITRRHAFVTFSFITSSTLASISCFDTERLSIKSYKQFSLSPPLRNMDMPSLGFLPKLQFMIAGVLLAVFILSKSESITYNNK